jgi:hypothetical protein
MNTQDQKIRKWIQSAEKDIPVTVEQKFLQELNRLSQKEPVFPKKPRPWISIAAAAAVCAILALWIIIPLMQKPSGQSEEAVLVQQARIQGRNAQTIIYKEKDPELTIVWIEK